jgi:metallo-beta-lactamase family protein
MLLDSAHIQENDAQYINKKRFKKGLEPITPLYIQSDVDPALHLFEAIDFEKEVPIHEGVTTYFRDNGHILGSGSVFLRIQSKNGERRIGFTGDIGRPNRPILKDPIHMEDVDYLISESTYGGRFHESFPDDKEYFLKVIIDCCVQTKG